MKRSRVVDRLEGWIVELEPAVRRRLAIHVLLWATVGEVVNVGLFLAGVVDEGALIFVTLVLSWFAVQVSAIDVVATTDVRVVEEE